MPVDRSKNHGLVDSMILLLEESASSYSKKKVNRMREAILSASRCQVTKMTKVNYFLSMATTKSTPKCSYVFPSDILNTHCVA